MRGDVWSRQLQQFGEVVGDFGDLSGLVIPEEYGGGEFAWRGFVGEKDQLIGGSVAGNRDCARREGGPLTHLRGLADNAVAGPGEALLVARIEEGVEGPRVVRRRSRGAFCRGNSTGR